MTMVNVAYTNTVEHSEYSEEEYGPWYSCMSSDVYGVCLERLDTSYSVYDKIDMGVDVAVGDTVYVVSMIYSSGDSFGHSEGHLEIIWCFKDVELAEACRVEYEKKTYSVEFMADNGNMVKNSNPASGYFEHISSIDIDKFTIASYM